MKVIQFHIVELPVYITLISLISSVPLQRAAIVLGDGRVPLPVARLVDDRRLLRKHGPKLPYPNKQKTARVLDSLTSKSLSSIFLYKYLFFHSDFW